MSKVKNYIWEKAQHLSDLYGVKSCDDIADEIFFEMANNNQDTESAIHTVAKRLLDERIAREVERQSPLPEGFSVRLHSFCGNCPKFQPDWDGYQMKSMVSTDSYYVFTCQNYQACQHIYNTLKEETKYEKENN